MAKFGLLRRFASSMVISFAIASQCVLAAPKVKVVPVPNGGSPIVAKSDDTGKIHLVVDSAEGPQYFSSTDGGKTLERPLPLVDRASRKPGLEFITWDVAVTREGAVHVVLGTNAWKLKLPKAEWGFMYTRLSPGENAFTPIRNINHRPSEGFSLAASESGTVTAVWMADKLFTNVSQDGGKTFGDTVEIDPALNPCNCCTTSSVYGKDGRLAILYREETNNDRDMYVALWDQKENKVTKTRVGTTPWKIDSCPMTYYSIVRDGDGFVAAWPTSEKRDIYFSRLDSNCQASGPIEIKTPGSCGMRSGVIALPAADRTTLVAWKKNGKLGWQLFDGNGGAVSSVESVDSPGSGAAGVLSKNGEFILFR